MCIRDSHCRVSCRATQRRPVRRTRRWPGAYVAAAGAPKTCGHCPTLALEARRRTTGQQSQ
eukprot:3220231-Alexandrium_andersonii.AAC.1